MNGKLTLGENISDLGGLKIAYLALQKALEGKPRAPIDGLTPEQRFFLSYAQALAQPRTAPSRSACCLQTDAHSPAALPREGPAREHARVRDGVLVRSREDPARRVGARQHLVK